MSIVEGGEKLLVSAAVYQYLGDPPTTSISDAEYTAIPTGLPYFPDGIIVQDSTTGAMSIVEGGKKLVVMPRSTSIWGPRRPRASPMPSTQQFPPGCRTSPTE